MKKINIRASLIKGLDTTANVFVKLKAKLEEADRQEVKIAELEEQLDTCNQQLVSTKAALKGMLNAATDQEITEAKMYASHLLNTIGD